jgi:hypothetical protein
VANPIPLADPQGVIYAYACGVCHHVRANSHFIGPHDPERVDRMAKSYEDDAARCCTCQRCGNVLTTKERAVWASGNCDACRPIVEKERAEAVAQHETEEEVANKRKAKALEAAKDVPAAQLLALRMSELSEEHYCAGWLHGLEYSLWAMLQGGNRLFGLGEVSVKALAELLALHLKCGGWWFWEENCGEVFVTTAEWEKILAAAST